MEKPHIYKYDEVDINNIEYGDPVKKGQSYKCHLSYEGNALYVQTPVLKCVSNNSFKTLPKTMGSVAPRPRTI